MLVLRLQRTGRKNVPAYRLVVAEKSAPIKGGVKEYLGHYLPTRDPHIFEFNKDRIDHWISQGAKPTDTVARLLNREGMENVEKFTKRYTKQKKRKEMPEEEKKAPVAEEKPTEEQEGGDTEEKKE